MSASELASIALTLVGIVAFAATQPSGREISLSAGTSVTPGTSSTAPVQIRIVLDQTVVTAGTLIHGEALVTNTTGQTVTVHGCPKDQWLFVGLSNAQISFAAGQSAVGCSPSAFAARLPPGVTRFPITVRTTYDGCTPPWSTGKATPDAPACIPTGTPPRSAAPQLPAGEYLTKAFVTGLPAGSQDPPPIQVTLLPAHA